MKEALKKKYTKRLPDLPATDIPKEEARMLTPPGSHLGCEPKHGTWRGFYDPYPSRAKNWRKWGEQSALIHVLRYLWVRYLIDEGWDTDQCPIKGLFEAGETVEELFGCK